MKKRSLKVSLYRVFAVSVFMPFLLISLFLPYFFNYQLLNSYKTNNKIILQTIVNYLDSSLQNAERFFMQYLVDTNISGFYQYVNRNEIDTSQEHLYQYVRYSSKYRSSLNNYLTMADDNHKGLGFFPQNANEDNLFYLPKYGNSVIRYKKEDLKEQEWYQELMDLQLGEILFLPGSIMTGCEEYEEEPVFTMIRPINHLETASRLGYAYMELSETIFSDLALEVTLPEGAGLAVYFPDGTLAYATEEAFATVGDLGDGDAEVMGKKVKVEGRAHYLYNMKEDSYGFFVYYLLPQNTILKEANHTVLVIFLVWCAALLAAFFLFVNLSRRISVSTSKIVTYIQKYRLGDADSQENISRMPIEEFDDISSALREMTERISDLVQHEYIWKMNQQMAEYKAMQAEINPHFFNNVMNSLQALNRMGDKKNLEKGIVNLSRMFRYTCEHGYESNIRQECQFIENYLALEKIRFEERLQYTIHVEKEIENFPIPKLLLQPLIENAMRHGMYPDGRCLSVVLEANRVVDKNGRAFVWIVVANDGIPYKEENILAGERVGIANVRDRLFIAYPDSFFWYGRNGSFRTVCNLLISLENEPFVLKGLEEL